MPRTPFATLADLDARHPRELAVLAADERTRVVDPARVEAALADVSTEIAGLLASRYAVADLDRLDEASLGVLRLYALDMALYRVAYPPRVTEAITARYEAAVKRLSAMAAGRGGLSFTPAGGAAEGASPAEAGPIAPNEVVLVAPDRLFTRERFRRGG